MRVELFGAAPRATKRNEWYECVLLVYVLRNQTPPSVVCHATWNHSLSWTPAWICPQPIKRQCFSTRRDRATFSPSLVHTGEVS